MRTNMRMASIYSSVLKFLWIVGIITKLHPNQMWFTKKHKISIYCKSSGIWSAVVYLANTGRVFGSSGSLEQAGGDGRWAFLDQLPEAGGEMSGCWIRSLALFPRCQVELLGRPTGKNGCGESYHRNLWCSQDSRAAGWTHLCTQQVLF